MTKKIIFITSLSIILFTSSFSLSSEKIWRYVYINNGVRILLGDDIDDFMQYMNGERGSNCLKSSAFGGCSEICFILDGANLIEGMIFKQYPEKTFSGLLDEYSKLLGPPSEIIPDVQAIWRDESTEMTLTNSNNQITITVNNAS